MAWPPWGAECCKSIKRENPSRSNFTDHRCPTWYNASVCTLLRTVTLVRTFVMQHSCCNLEVCIKLQQPGVCSRCSGQSASCTEFFLRAGLFLTLKLSDLHATLNGYHSLPSVHFLSAIENLANKILPDIASPTISAIKGGTSGNVEDAVTYEAGSTRKHAVTKEKHATPQVGGLWHSSVVQRGICSKTMILKAWLSCHGRCSLDMQVVVMP